jgi:hypothetical protein
MMGVVKKIDKDFKKTDSSRREVRMLREDGCSVNPKAAAGRAIYLLWRLTKMVCRRGDLEKQATIPMGLTQSISFVGMCALALAKPTGLFRMSWSRRACDFGCSRWAGKNSRFFMGKWISSLTMLKEGILLSSLGQ